MIPTPITLDDDRQDFEYVVYVNQHDVTGNDRIDMPIGHSPDLTAARNVLDGYAQALIMLAAPDVTVKTQPLDALSGRITMTRDDEVFTTLNVRIQIETVATVRRLFDEAQ